MTKDIGDCPLSTAGPCPELGFAQARDLMSESATVPGISRERGPRIDVHVNVLGLRYNTCHFAILAMRGP